MNLPMGPTSTAQQWRAAARLGVAIMGAIVWTKTINLRIALVTRIMEKDSWLTSLVIQHIIKICIAKGVLHQRQTAVFWSDGGPHYRSIIQLSSYASWIPQTYNIHTKARYGCEYHMKCEVDA
jgi:hypothetical protein